MQEENGVRPSISDHAGQCQSAPPRRRCRAGLRCQSHAAERLRSGWFAAPCRGSCPRWGDDGEFCPASAFSSELLPAFGWPAMTTLIPLRAATRPVAHAGAPGQCGLQALQLAPGVGFLQEINVFFREVQRGLHQHAQVDQCIAQCVNLVRKRAGQRPAGAARCSLGAGVDQVGNCLGLGQVDLVVQNARSVNSPGCATRSPAAPGLRSRCLALLPGSAPAATGAPPARHGPATPARPHRCRSGVPGSTGPAPGLWPGPAHHETAGRWPRAGVMLARTTPSPEAPNLCQKRGQCPPPPAGSGGNGDDGINVTGKHGRHFTQDRPLPSRYGRPFGNEKAACAALEVLRTHSRDQQRIT